MKFYVGSDRLNKWTRRLAVGTAVLGLGGCDQNVRDTVIVGLEDASIGLASTLIQAFFTTFAENFAGSTTVKVVFDEFTRMMA
jgi:hypothetical protein